MKNRRVLIVEDEYVIAEHLREIMERLDYTVRAAVRSVADALPYLQQEPQPDLVLLDIMLVGELDGIDLAHRLRALSTIPFIFVTSLADAATLNRAKHTHPHGYIVKPFTERTVYAALEMAFANHTASFATEIRPALAPPTASATASASPPLDSLFVRERKQLTRVRFDDILWLQAEGNYTSVYTRDSKYTMLGGLKEVAERLPKASFIRLHKSYLVALGAITAVDAQGVLVGEHRIPVGRSYQAELASRLNITGTP